MSKRLVGILIAGIFLIFTTTAYAESSEEVLEGMAKKLKRGAINTFTGWLELPLQIIKGFNEGFMYDEENKLLGVACGMYEGLTHSAGRTLSGVIDMASFWAVDPKDNIDTGIPFDAEYAWEKGMPHNMFDPNFTDATVTPVVNKFLRGVGNTVFGFMEFPSQICKGVSEGSSEFGIFKGLWYWCSREISGISDIATAPLPNPEYTVGPTFDEEWPWEGIVKMEYLKNGEEEE